MNDGTEWINTKSDFVQFLHGLQKGYQEHPQGWENNTIESFLDALAAYAEDINGYYVNQKIPSNPNQASWRIFAQIISGAAIYE